MRKLLSVCLISASLILAQCTTTQVQQIETFIGKVQAATAQVCKFIPTVDTIINFVNAGIGQIVGAVAVAICNVVPPVASAQYKALPRASSGAPPVVLRAGTPSTPTVSGWRV